LERNTRQGIDVPPSAATQTVAALFSDEHWRISVYLPSKVIAVALMAASFMVGNATTAAAQSADAEARCTGDVMRLCSEFVPDADSIVVCLKAKRLQLEASCLNALLPAPPQSFAMAASPKKKVRKAGATLVLTVTERSANVRHRTTAAR
jgi:hypothetical protein